MKSGYWSPFRTVSELEVYIKSKLRKLREKESMKHDDKVGGFIRLLEEILALSYFKDYSGVSINDFKDILKNVRNEMLTFVEQQRANLEGYRSEYERANRELNSFQKEHSMDDDSDQQLFSERMRLETEVNEAYNDIITSERHIKESEEVANLIHRLLGIIVRSDGFFEKVL